MTTKTFQNIQQSLDQQSNHSQQQQQAQIPKPQDVIEPFG